MSLWACACGGGDGDDRTAPSTPPSTANDVPSEAEPTEDSADTTPATAAESDADAPSGIVLCVGDGPGGVSLLTVDPDTGSTEEWAVDVLLAGEDTSLAFTCEPGNGTGFQGSYTEPWATRSAFSSDWRYIATSRTSEQYAGSHAGVIDTTTGDFIDLSGESTDSSGEFASTEVRDGPPAFDASGNLVWHRLLSDNDTRVTLRSNGLTPGAPETLLEDGSFADAREWLWTDPDSGSPQVAQVPVRVSPDGSHVLQGGDGGIIICPVTLPLLTNEDIATLTDSPDALCRSDVGVDGFGGFGVGAVGWLDDTSVLGTDMVVYDTSGDQVTQGRVLVPESDRDFTALAVSADRQNVALEVDGGLWIQSLGAGSQPEMLLETLPGSVVAWTE